MKFEDRRIEGQEMKSYKGYGIDKSWEMVGNKRVPNSVRYMVIDEDDDWIGDVYTTLDEAKAYIDSLVSKEVKASTRVVKANSYRPFGLLSKSDDMYDILMLLEDVVSEKTILQHLINHFPAADVVEALTDLADEVIDIEEE